MTWTVACFCGNVYTAPPARCDVCNRTLSRAVTDGPAAVVPVLDAFPETEDAASHTPTGQAHGSPLWPIKFEPSRGGGAGRAGDPFGSGDLA
jgi:hypothetical protein